MKDITLLQGDCLELIEHIEDGSIDMVLTDPPYSSGGMFAGDRKASTKEKYTNGATKLPSFSGDNMDQRAFTEFMRMVFARARRKTKDEGIIAAFVDWRNLPAMTDAIQMAGWIWRGIVPWNKGCARNIPGRYRQDCEFIVWGTNGPKSVVWEKGNQALPGCYNTPSISPNKRHHQAEKPVPLLEDLLKIAPANAYIFDPFMGSGSTGVACINTEKRFIGIELNKDIYETARQRTEEAAITRELAYTD